MLGDKNREVGQREVDGGERRCRPLVLDEDLVLTFVPRGSASCDLGTENKRRLILLSLVVSL